MSTRGRVVSARNDLVLENTLQVMLFLPGSIEFLTRGLSQSTPIYRVSGVESPIFAQRCDRPMQWPSSEKLSLDDKAVKAPLRLAEFLLGIGRFIFKPTRANCLSDKL